ncbi:hypothetical protein KHQ06_34630 [Nocardia tengchongensis]|uniref:DUF320 domain-containing protein n=1 Tax=Nocardia tengchongensis TaxID=2055889 RepID=A0ABX8CQ14_9NOCA|nr:hypothetical protein [Nocardia tengchongensis]QVI21113.1 hypothetical protein KHQ06_34630 [Nocardia tengchongensis]
MRILIGAVAVAGTLAVGIGQAAAEPLPLSDVAGSSSASGSASGSVSPWAPDGCNQSSVGGTGSARAAGILAFTLAELASGNMAGVLAGVISGSSCPMRSGEVG